MVYKCLKLMENNGERSMYFLNLKIASNSNKVDHGVVCRSTEMRCKKLPQDWPRAETQLAGAGSQVPRARSQVAGSPNAG